jgi:hypothetical protein
MVLRGIGVTDVGISSLSLLIYQGSSDSGSGNVFILFRKFQFRPILANRCSSER